MVNLSVLMAVVFLWRFRLRVVPLLLSPSCVTQENLEEQISCEHFFSARFTYGHVQLSERGNKILLI